MKFRNFKGVMTEAPADLYQHVASFYDGLIVWSRRGNLHQVRYGLEVESFQKYGVTKDEPLGIVTTCMNPVVGAQNRIGECIRHYAECEGLLDD